MLPLFFNVCVAMAAAGFRAATAVPVEAGCGGTTELRGVGGGPDDLVRNLPRLPYGRLMLSRALLVARPDGSATSPAEADLCRLAASVRLWNGLLPKNEDLERTRPAC